MRFNKIILVCFAVLLLALSVMADENETVESSVQLTGNIPTTTVEVNEAGDSGDELMALSPNASTLIACWGVADDIDGLSDLASVTAVLFANESSRGGDDNESLHYTNNSCDLTNLNVDGSWNCTFDVEYFAINTTWNCSVNVTNSDSQYYNDTEYDTAIIEELLALDIHNATIDFGLRAVDVEYDANDPVLVYNEGNVGLDLQLDAWEQNATGGTETESDSAFNCTVGTVPVTGLVFSTSNVAYGSATPLVAAGATGTEQLNLAAQVGGGSLDPTSSLTYWGISVPSGNAGTCTGNIRYIGVRDN